MKCKLLIYATFVALLCAKFSYSQCPSSVAGQNTIYGTVYNDANQNGNQGGAEAGLQNIGLNLYEDTNINGIIDGDEAIVATATSDASGDYTIAIPEIFTTENVADHFDATAWTGNNGSVNFSNNWQEIGESGVTSGNVRVNSNKLRFGRYTEDDSNISGDGVHRTINMSGYVDATLSFDFNKDIDDNDELDFSVNVQVSTDGTTYTTIDNISFYDANQNYSYDISAYITTATYIRFVGSGEVKEETANYIFFDNINIALTANNGYFTNYIVSIDDSTIGSGITKTTSSNLPVTFTGIGQRDCNNDFGLYTCGPNCNPIADDDYVSITQGESTTIDVLDNDSDGDGNLDATSLLVLTNPSNGAVSIDGLGNIIYSANGSFVGTDTFTYQVCDTTSPTPLCDTATVTIDVSENFTDPCIQAVQEQIYYVPYSDDDLRTALYNSADTSTSSCNAALTDFVNRVISIKSPYPGSVITYDHWEDGFEADINNPVQATTQVWGDEDISNGTSPNYSTDYIPSGGDIVLENTYNYNPRNITEIVYDGRDKIVTSNDIAMSSVAGDIDRFDVQLAKTDVYSIDKFGTSFTVPFGEDLGQEFQYTGLFIRASEDSTTVNVDLDNDGNIDSTENLNEGEVMFVDGGVDSGATITSNLAVGVDMFFGGLDCFGTRQINLYPGKFYSDIYYSPVPTVNSAAPSVVYFYNNLSRSINIDWSSNANTGTIAVAAKSSASLSLSDNSGYKFQSQDGSSYVASQVVDSDASGSAYDWAFNLISEDRLTDFAAIAWAPGTIDYSGNVNPVWVTPTANTTLYIKYDGDLTDASASTSPCGIPYDQSVPVNALNYAKILDTFNNDNDQGGLSVYTCDGTKIFAVYGEDPSLASSSGSGSMDVGTTMQPLCLKALVFANDDYAYGLIDTPTTVQVSYNDTTFLTNINLNSISTAGLLQPENGQIKISYDGSITYLPNAGFMGEDTFEYSICSLEYPDTCDTATVTVTISNCPTPNNKNLIFGQVYFDLNEDTINNDAIGIEDISVDLYIDNNISSTVDAGDTLISSTNSNNDGSFSFEAPSYNVEISDDFSSQTYTGGTGWSGNWTEVGDDGNPTSGNVRIENKKDRLRVKNNDSAYRTANLAGVSNANISFTVREFGKIDAADLAVIEICSDNSFSNCQTLFIKANDFVGASVNATVIEPDKLTANTVLRSRVTGYTASDEFFFLDDIIIRYEVRGENLVLEVDTTTVPSGYTFSTDNIEVVQFTSGTLGVCEKANDFGLLRCNLSNPGIDIVCDDNGTPYDGSDDTYSITLDPAGTRLSGTYTVSGDITGTGIFGVSKTFGPYAITSGNKIISIIDASGNCELEDIEIDVTTSSCLLSNTASSIDFDGIDDYIDSNLDLSNFEQLTAMVWVKLDPDFSNEATVLNQGDFEISVSNTRRVSLKVNNAVIAFSDENTLELNKWAHIALIYNRSLPSNQLKTYLNGRLVSSSSDASLVSAITASSDLFTVGKKAASSVNYFKGDIDEVRIFDVALTEDQMSKIVYQEVQENSGSVSGLIIPKTIVDYFTTATIPWTNLRGYYPMTDIQSSKTSDFSSYGNAATLHNITTILEQTAPMPYQTSGDGDWNDESTWLHGDVWDIDGDDDDDSSYIIAKVSHDVEMNSNIKTLGLLVDSGKTITMNGTNEINNSWYIGLDGTIDLKEDSQLVQGIQSDLVTSTNGKILRRQEGTSNIYWYNYWSSPVGATAATSYLDNNSSSNNPNNTPFTLNMLKDGTGANIQYTSAQSAVGEISTEWLYAFENGVTYYDWNQLSLSTTLKSGVGYTQKGTGLSTSQQYIFEGKPNNGTIKIAAIDTGGAGSVESVSLTSYLVGNPYASAIDARQFITDNTSVTNNVIDGTILLWEQWAGASHVAAYYEGGYAYVNKMTTVAAAQYPYSTASGSQPGGTKRPSFYIPVGQGFFVEVINDGDIEFNNGQRVFVKESDGSNANPYVGSTFLRASNSSESETQPEPETTSAYQMLRLELEMSDTSSRTIVLGFDEGFTDAGREHGFDGGLIQTPLVNDLGSLLNGEQYVIQALSPITEDKVVDLTFTATGTENYTIKNIEITNIAETQEIYLRDNLLGVYFDLRNEQGYNFTSEAGTFNDRFDIVFTPSEALSTDDFNTADNTTTFFNNAQETLYVKGLEDDVKQLQIYNALGQVILTKQNMSSSVLESGITISTLSTGLYIVSIKTENNITIDKKIIIE